MHGLDQAGLRAARAGEARDRVAFLGLALAFFASGFAALLYQVVWQRMLGIFAGSDAVTAALVVGAFLMGIGLGSLAASLVADRRSPRMAARAFAACEAAIAVFALASTPFLYDFLAIRIGPYIQGSAAIFLACFLGLLAPTFAMGLSLPLVSKAVVPGIETAALRIGTLYGLNTLGAAAGALIGGFVLVGTLGFQGTLAVGAALNAGAGVIALWLARGLSDIRPARAPVAAAAPVDGSLAGWTVLVFASGFLIVALEIIWLRILGLSAQHNAYVFALILGVFLVADGLGLVVGARLVHRIADLRGSFLRMQGVAVLAALAGVALFWGIYGWEPFVAVMAVDKFRLDITAMLIVAASSLVLVGPAAFLLGMTFPITQAAVQRDLGSLGFRVAIVNLGNIVGNAVGGIVAGLVLLHFFGTAGALVVIGVIALGLTAWAFGGPRRVRTALVAASLATGMLVFPSNDAFWSRIHGVQDGQRALLAEDRSGVALLRLDEDGGPLFIGGHAQSRIPFHPHHFFLGALGPALHPAPSQVMVIGVGSGGTPFAGGWNPATQRVRAVELVAPVYEVIRDYAALHPESAPARMLRDPRFVLEVGDGRRDLLAGEARYDVIEADAILAQTSHSGMLYSVEFLKGVAEKLKPGGLFVQWAPTGRVVESFLEAFPHVVMLRPISALIGSDRPIAIDPATLRARLGDPAFRAWAQAAGVDPARFPSMFAEPPVVWGPERTRAEGEANHDLFPRDEYYLNNPVVPPDFAITASR
jgi:predicted membrane-bound spermidine synthase